MSGLGGRMRRDELLRHLAAERLGLEQRRLAARRQITALQREVDEIDGRLIDIDHAEGLLK